MKFLLNKIFLPSGIQSKLLSFRKNSFRIIYFHYAGNKVPDYQNYKSHLLTTKDLKKLIAFYKKEYKIVSIHEALNRIANNESLEKFIAFSTDDGLRENYSIFAPIFIEEKIPLSVFVTTSVINNKHLLWNNKIIYINNVVNDKIIKNLTKEMSAVYNIAPCNGNESIVDWSNRAWSMKNKEEYSDWLWNRCISESVESFLYRMQPYLDSKQIKELSNESEFITIGSHSDTHPIFNKIEYAEIKLEVHRSIEILEKITNSKINLFAYPYGIRPRKEFEIRLINEPKHKVSTLLGTRHNLNNFNDPFVWERDRQEFNYNLSMLRFSVVPIIRYFSTKKSKY